MIKVTKIKLKLISDIEMHYFIEEEITGRISYICKRFTKANNKYMNNYDPTRANKYIMYIDAKNLYGWTMSKYLPYGGFKWLKNNDNFDIKLSQRKQSGKLYILKVDLENPDKLHELYHNYPLAPEKLEITYDMLSDHSKKIADKYGLKVGGV